MQGAEGRSPETDTTLQGWPTGWALCSSTSGGSRVSRSLTGSSLNSISDTIDCQMFTNDRNKTSKSPKEELVKFYCAHTEHIASKLGVPSRNCCFCFLFPETGSHQNCHRVPCINLGKGSGSAPDFHR